MPDTLQDTTSPETITTLQADAVVPAEKPIRGFTAARIMPSAASRREAIYDAELVRRFNAGDEAAFVEIMERYKEKVFYVALALLHNRADAEEIAQDTFIRAHASLSRFRGESSLATWLHRIAFNLSSNRYWYFFRRRRHATRSLDCALTEESDATFADIIASDTPTPDRDAMIGEFSSMVEKCMEKLDVRQREILTLRTILNHSYAEIAQMLGITIGTVKSRIARARGSLNSLLAKECPEFSADASPSDWFELNGPAATVGWQLPETG